MKIEPVETVKTAPPSSLAVFLVKFEFVMFTSANEFEAIAPPLLFAEFSSKAQLSIVILSIPDIIAPPLLPAWLLEK